MKAEKKVDTWMPLLVDKYLGDTQHLSTEQHGAYLLILLAMWKRDGQLPARDLPNVTRLTPMRWRAHEAVLMEFFDITDGHVTQKRLVLELARAKKATEAKAKAGAEGAAKRWGSGGNGEPDGRPIADPLANASQTDASIPIPRDSSSKKRSRNPTDSSSARPTIPCPYALIVDRYHEALPDLPRVKLMTKSREAALRKTWGWLLRSTRTDGARRATTADEALAWFKTYFERASANDFLMGRGERSGAHAGWRCDLDFLLTDKGMRHVIEKTEAAA